MHHYWNHPPVSPTEYGEPMGRENLARQDFPLELLLVFGQWYDELWLEEGLSSVGQKVVWRKGCEPLVRVLQDLIQTVG